MKQILNTWKFDVISFFLKFLFLFIARGCGHLQGMLGFMRLQGTKAEVFVLVTEIARVSAGTPGVNGGRRGGYEGRGLSRGSRAGSGVEKDEEKSVGEAGEPESLEGARMGHHRDSGWVMAGPRQWAPREAWENEPLLLESAPENHGWRNRNATSQVWVGEGVPGGGGTEGGTGLRL